MCEGVVWVWVSEIGGGSECEPVSICRLKRNVNKKGERERNKEYVCWRMRRWSVLSEESVRTMPPMSTATHVQLFKDDVKQGDRQPQKRKN